ncbi:MAG: DNA translocase FtsK [Chloroflexi bacterium]|nr:DNA translocase FtsK [Chloroflexota bacterium]
MAHKEDIKSKGTPTENVSRADFMVQVWLRFERFAWDLGGVLVLAISLMTLLGLIAPEITGGALLSIWVIFLRRWLGWGSFFVVIGGTFVGLLLLRRRSDGGLTIRWRRIFLFEGAAFAALILFTVLGQHSLARAEAGLDGGLVGWGLTELLGLMFSPFWTAVFAGIALLAFLVSGFNLSVWLSRMWAYVLDQESSYGISAASHTGVSIAPLDDTKSVSAPKRQAERNQQKVAKEHRKSFRVEQNDERPLAPLPRSEDLPPLDLLTSERATRPSEKHINQRAGLIEQTLAEFNIPAKVVGFQVGPTVTQFAVEPGYIEKSGATADEIARLRKVRVSQIAGLSRDLALSLAAERLRIQAPVPGRPYVGIEVPNVSSSVVRLRSILETETYYKAKTPLALALGRDVSGEAVVADLASMPHLLIAGTTGSGKSVSVAAMTVCLAMNNSPEDLRLVMIDPKMVELIRFNGLPHLLGKVETSLERILGVLQWVVAEMDRRYKLLEESRSRNIDTFNRKMRSKKESTLPRIVVLLDELADLMMSAPEQTEHNLVRLAQMARATGIHLVVATQRPSTDVVTGLIKANFPARISFSVASSIDSRVILDTTGAEHLLGNGDMLFLRPESGSPTRVQGVWVTDQELERVVNFWQKAYPSEPDDTAPWEKILEKESVLADRDNLIEDAIKLVQQTHRASTSMIQRQLRIGYPRAARLMDELEELGVVGPSMGSGQEREVLISPDENPLDWIA